MMRREFSSQHHSSSPATTSSSSTTASSNAPTTQSTPSVATTSTSPISRRRQRIARQQQHRRSSGNSSRIGSHHHHHHSLRSSCHLHPSKASSSSSNSSFKLALRNPALAHKLHQMALPLSPLVQLSTGAIHPDFPTTVLQFWLLTDSQLEALAAFYHQSGAPSPWAAQYPCPVRWRSHAPLEEKRRRMGRFIGLRGCESPVLQHAPPQQQQQNIKTEEEIAREARMARLAADEEALRRKTAPGPWSR